MSLMNFANYIDNTGRPNEPAVLTETFSTTVVKAAAVGILMKMNQLRQRIEQDRTADSAQKSIASMLFLMASMLTVAIASMTKGPELANRAKRY